MIEVFLYLRLSISCLSQIKSSLFLATGLAEGFHCASLCPIQMFVA